VLIPLQPHFFALQGLSKLLETTALVAKRINPALKVTGIVLCLYEASTRLTQEVMKDLQDFLDKGRNSPVPWSQARVFTTRVRRNIKLAECPSFGQSIFAYAPTCHGAKDYMALAREVLGETPTVLAARVEIDDRGRANVVHMQAEAAPEAALQE
jgi:chromosome partitioning protein